MVSSPQGISNTGLTMSDPDALVRYGVMHQSLGPLVLAAVKMVEQTVSCDANCPIERGQAHLHKRPRLTHAITSITNENSSPEEQFTDITPHNDKDFYAQAEQLNHSDQSTEFENAGPEKASISVHNAIIDMDKHGFLCTENLKCLPSEDINYLLIKGSLNVPDHDTTKEFVVKYFEKLHPMLPVLDEAQFWRAFRGNTMDKISLFIFRALMFAISPFMSLDTLQKCGFVDKRDARKHLYNRAKLLFDLKVEMKPSAKAQGAVLLTHHTSAIAPLAGSLWLTSAIENAMLIDAQPSLVEDYINDSMKKRLWWSILLRDRSLCIGLRRRPQVTSLNLHGCRDWLREQDFEDEMHSSEVYDYQTKAIFLSALQEQCTLAILLTDLVSLIFNPRLTPTASYSEDEFESQMNTLNKVTHSLIQWHSKAHYPPNPRDNRCPHPSAALKNMTFMYYHTARVDLAQYTALLIEEYPGLPRHRYQQAMMSVGRDLKGGIDGLSQIMEYFSVTGHVDNLPLSILAYVGMPLVVAAIDLKLSPSRTETAARQRRLDSLSKIIRHAESLYDVTDFVAAGTNHILQLAYMTTQNFFLARETLPTKNNTGERNDSTGCNNMDQSDLFSRSSSPKHTRAKNWLDAFILCPRAYLLISTSVDYSLSVGRLPYDNSLPALVREISNQFSMCRLPWSLDDKPHTYFPQSRVNERLDSIDLRPTTGDGHSCVGESGGNANDENPIHEIESTAGKLNVGNQVNPASRGNQAAHDMSSSLVNLDFFEIESDPRSRSMLTESSIWTLP
ncbi:Transcription factor [Penicillium longicatenatum]|uniref:Transcription factor n=1 Tax=Penicillium longicatenatum TaxID=1561947 RepID=UPI0025497420|nr:Transcription factor [Penicillium longicatenatum]KAJ5636862.1 Transcription factor [Penicillium longicatenatum]